MRLVVLVTVSALGGAAGCGLFDDTCAGNTLVASDTPALAGGQLDAWMQQTCSTQEDDLCSEGIPRDNSLMLCSHDRSVRATDGGAFQALKCDFYSDAKSCHSGSIESHVPPNLPVPPPPG